MGPARDMARLGRRPDRRRLARGRSSLSGAAAAAALLSVSSASVCTSSSASLASPACFVSPPHCSNRRAIAAPTRSRLQHLPRPPPSPRQSRLAIAEGNDHISNDEDKEEEEEEELNGIKSNLKKISWLPSVKLGKQPYWPSTLGRQAPLSRKENAAGNSYEDVESSGNNGRSNPPGYQNIEILPVLPMAMVDGLEGMLMDDAYEEESMDNDNSYYSAPGNYYGAGVWEEDSSSSTMGDSLGPLFSGTFRYLPHTKGHVFTVAEPRYKKLYDDLIRMGNYYGIKRDSALRRTRAAKEKARSTMQGLQDGENADGDEDGEEDVFSTATASAQLPDPNEKRRFIVTTTHPTEDGVFAEYGLLFQLKNLQEVAAVAIDELQDLVESADARQAYDPGEADSDGEDAMDILLRTHYEATHDVIGRVKIHRFNNPECYTEGGPDGEEYLMAEATIVELVESDRARMLRERKQRRVAASVATVSKGVESEEVQPTTSATSHAADLSTAEEVEDVAKAVARIKEELRSSVGEAFKKQQQSSPQQQADPESIKEKLRAALDHALDEAPTYNGSSEHGGDVSDGGGPRGKKASGPTPLVPKGILVERRPTASLTAPEHRLRESFAKLVSLQHELGEECRFTRVSIQTFGIGPVGVWLSAAAWSQFVEKRLEASHSEMQGDLQKRLSEYLGLDGSAGGRKAAGGRPARDDGAEGGAEGGIIDFDDLSPELQREFQLTQARAAAELGPVALERAIQMQLIVQADSYAERLDLLSECVDNERCRLGAKKMLRSLGPEQPNVDENDNTDRGGRGFGRDVFGGSNGAILREEARTLFERLMSNSEGDGSKEHDPQKDEEEEAFQ